MKLPWEDRIDGTRIIWNRQAQQFVMVGQREDAEDWETLRIGNGTTVFHREKEVLVLQLRGAEILEITYNYTGGLQKNMAVVLQNGSIQDLNEEIEGLIDWLAREQDRYNTEEEIAWREISSAAARQAFGWEEDE